MKSFAVLLVVLCVAAGLAPQGVRASPLGVPAAIYPAGAHIAYRPVLTNAEMDCRWGFFCEGDVPLFHFQTQDQLHRVAGGAQFAGVQHHGRKAMSFELFVSRYDLVRDAAEVPWSKQAFLDLKLALHFQDYALDRRALALLPTTGAGGRLVTVQLLGKQDLVVMAWWSGALEIEGIALYDHRPAVARQVAWTSLAAQIQRAVERGA